MQEDTFVALARMEERMKAERERTDLVVAHAKDRVELALSFRDHALEIQAKEYERRLDTLNHENARILAAAAKSVEAGYFEARMNAVTDRVGNLEKGASGLTGRSGGMDVFKNNLFAILALLIALASLLLR